MQNVLISILLMLVSSTAFSQNTQEVRKIIDHANATVSREYASDNINAVVKFFAKDAWQMPPNSPPLIGREAIAKYWKQAVQWGHWQFTLHAQDVEVSGPMAVERGKYVLKFTAGPTAPAGMPSFEDRGNYLVYWRHEKDGQWRIVADAPVSELPLNAPPSH
ncbi:MAG: YybH family protein [Gammaproteobacteria bacterium]